MLNRNPWLSYFAVFNALLAALVTATTVPTSELYPLSTGSFFITAGLSGHFLFLAFLLTLPLLLISISPFSQRKQLCFAVLVYSAFILIVLINSRVFSIYRFHLNGMVLNLIGGDDALEILSIQLKTWVIWIAILIGLIITEYVIATRLYSNFKGRQKKPVLLWVSIVSVMLLGQVFYAYSDAVGDKQVTRMLRYIPWAMPLTAKRNLHKLGFEMDESEQLSLTEPVSSALNYPRAALHCPKSDQPPHNIVVMVIDSLRFDMLDKEIMPNAAQLRASSWEFSDHYSTGNSTRFGFFGLMYGLPGSYWFPMLGEQQGSVLIDTLLAQNYQMLIRGSASWASPEFDRTVFAAILDQIVSGKDLQAKNGSDHRHRDSLTTDDFLQAIENRDQHRPFFGLLFMDAPHNYTRDINSPAPFQPALDRIDYLELDNDYNPDKFFNLYKNSVHYNDQLIGSVIDKLHDQNLLENTIVVFTSDHAQEFNESKQNYWGHNGNFSRFQTKVPLLIRWPGKGAKRISHRSSHEDLVPTLMQDNQNCNNPIGDYSTGQNLFSDDYQSRPLSLESWSRRAVLNNDRVYVFESYGDYRVYDESYRELLDEPIDKLSILDAMESMSRFLK